MDPHARPSITLLLGRIQNGDDAARQEVFDLAYAELRGLAKGLMRKERPEHTLQPTALVNEAAARMLQGESLEDMKCREYFFGAMARAMRQVLVAHARTRNRLKRGGEYQRVPLDEAIDHVEQEHQFDLVALDDALNDLQKHSERHSEVVTLRFFGGLAIDEIAEQLNVSGSTVVRDLRFARAWLGSRLEGSGG